MPGDKNEREKIDLSYAIKLAPEQAIDYFRSKGYTMSWHWYDTYQEGHRKAFTVAKATQMDVLEDIRKAVDKAISTGQSFRDFQKELTPKLQNKGWWGQEVGVNLEGRLEVGQFGSPERLKTIYRTNMAVALSAGRYRDQMESAEDLPYWQYNAIMDISTRPNHAQLNGFIFRYDDPFWNTHYPPCDWGCRCKVVALTESMVKNEGLKVMNSAGMLKDEQVEIAKGVVRTVTRFKGYGANMAPAPGWNYNPGRDSFSPPLEKYPPPVVKEYKSALKKAGLAQRFPVKRVGDITTLLKEYDKEYPGMFQRGFKKIETRKSGDAAGYTDSHGLIGVLNRSVYGGETLANYNPAESLISGLQKIEKGKDLSFGEERSIKTLWHEILHNSAKGWRDPRLRTSADTTYMEALNDFVARHTYPTFLESLGGYEAFGEKILSNGGGYDLIVGNLREVLRVTGINEMKALSPLSEVSFKADWIGMNKEIAKTLADLNGKITPETYEKILVLILNTPTKNIEGQIKIILEGAK